MSPTSSRECPQCHSPNLAEGAPRAQKNSAFVPRGRFMWFGYRVTSFACLDCGVIWNSIAEDQLAELRRKLSEG